VTLNPSCFAQVFQFPVFGLTFSQDVNNDIQIALPFWTVVEKPVQFDHGSCPSCFVSVLFRKHEKKGKKGAQKKGVE